MAESGAAPLKVFCERKTTIYLDWRAPGVALRGRNLVIGADTEDERVFPLLEIRRLVLIGKVNLPSLILYGLLRQGIPTDWLDVFGKPLGQMLSSNEETHFFMDFQQEFATSGQALELAKRLLLAKVDNCHEIIRRRAAVPGRWREERAALCKAEDFDSLRGYEGICARSYFSLWQGELHKFPWHGRQAHPAPDPVNMLLSLGYSLLYNRLASALHSVGLNPRCGFFHQRRGSHAALASDLMEPLRAFVDAAVLNMLRRQEVAPENFRVLNGRCVCSERGIFSKILTVFEEMFETEHILFISPEDSELKITAALNNFLDDLAASFALHIRQNGQCLIPRLKPCPSSL